MRYTSLALAASPLLVTVVSAWGNSVIENKCGNDVFFWEDSGEANPPMQTITPGNSFTKALYQTGKANGAGPSFKIGVAGANGQPPAFDASPITQFEYTVDAPNWPGFVSFDISNVNGGGTPPFVNGGVSVSSPQDGGASKTCAAGVNPCTQGYTNWNDDKWAMVQTAMANDIVMTLCGPKPGAMCGGGGASSGGQQQQQHESPQAQTPPAPSTTQEAPVVQQPHWTAPPVVPVVAQPHVEEKVKAAPAQQQQPSQPEKDEVVVVTVTSFAPPVIVTEVAKFKERRDGHVHQHAHAHGKINKRRHGA